MTSQITASLEPGTPAPRPESTPSRKRTSHSHGFSGGFVVKLVLMALINAFGLYGILASWAVGNNGILWFLVAALAVVNIVYFAPTRKLLPAKYLAPGLIFLLIFQVFVVIYTAGVAFTNYGDGHNSSKEDAIRALVQQHERRVDGTPQFPISVVQSEGGELGFATAGSGETVLVGTGNAAFQPVAGAETGANGFPVSVPGYEVLGFPDVIARQDSISELRIPMDGDSFLRTNDGRVAFVYEQGLVYNEATDTMTAADGTVYTATETGNFVSADGEVLSPGWTANVGFANFGAIFDKDVLGGPFLSVTLWTFAFALLSVATTFFLGLFIAMLFNDASMRGRSVYRAVIILPYAFPGFLSILIWAGLLNRDFGFINDVVLGGAAIPWLNDPWLAKLSLVLVNLWLGFPYMFLIATGALQSIPAELYESARMDGAGRWRAFKFVTLPLLLVAVGPMLIACFAMNFNNFNLIYLLTSGGPRDLDSTTGVGSTDILITFVYKLAFETGANQYGLASAVSILIFIMVAVVSAIAFRRSKALEEIS
ncbi:ABC transporter permease subunit [Hoyosella altamirensis]|uniref:Maltose/maltodextrin transport system permease protein n=1 Tax=Hoyosella altamirensis TaxID=616997 RepID=A0A839RQC7_9ACTN|nr:ABC transporter permease subunit [Hoyosella altamirensis]MBB3038519.1 arabinogalactan oligomer/maltooligosaccharide transport system permease protein [Hoyosella altamirensis]